MSPSQISWNIKSTPYPVLAETEYEDKPIALTRLLTYASVICEGMSLLLPATTIVLLGSELLRDSCSQNC